MLFRFRFIALAVATVATSLSTLALDAQARTCSVVVALHDAVLLGALSVRVGYQSGNFIDINGGCVNVMANSAASFGVNEQEQRLTLGFISDTGFQGPGELAHCQFEDANNDATLGDFAVTVIQAADPDGNGLAPSVRLSLPDCDPQESTTTTTTTSTTTTTLDLPERSCEVTFRLNGKHTIGALDWQVLYGSASGEFAGSGAFVECDTLPAGTLPSYNDIEAQNKILAAMITPAGFTSPAGIATCRFLPSGDDPVAGDFAVSVKKATTPELQEILPVPSMTVSEIECSTDGEPVCGNGDPEPGEECDDGNKDDGDGCSSECLVESPCGDANEDGNVLAGDSLRILRRAVGISVSCPSYVCDTNNDGNVLAGDSLRALQSAVGQQVVLNCPLP